VRFPLHQVSAEVFILPYPRRLSLESAAGPGLILLSPGVRPLSREHQHSEFVHELGHVVQYALFPDADADGWSKYARMRGIDAPSFNASAPHADRPHEIWAEDFRALFGGASATSNGTIENPSLSYPTEVQGLQSFMQGLAAGAPSPASARRRAATVGWGARRLAGFDARRLRRFGPPAGGRRPVAGCEGRVVDMGRSRCLGSHGARRGRLRPPPRRRRRHRPRDPAPLTARAVVHRLAQAVLSVPSADACGSRGPEGHSPSARAHRRPPTCPRVRRFEGERRRIPSGPVADTEPLA
jgi:hypothetical protein